MFSSKEEWFSMITLSGGLLTSLDEIRYMFTGILPELTSQELSIALAKGIISASQYAEYINF